ncbi:endonuclease/exonuclease/phosphatase family protein [Gilvimarinus sp. F26214L]|uniref:endonuclease/exonuclease/phosphatase family protein n=1 Tax=Gilvimarinus sp. DZF01 TaxID=3461371 RepID=UPI0040464243
MFVAFLIATIALVGIALLPQLHFESWVVRSFDFPRLQISIALVVLLVMELALLDLDQLSSWLLIVAAVVGLCYEAWWIIPYSPLFPVEVKQADRRNPDRTLRLMIANVLMSNRRADALLHLVRESNPDLLVTLETDQWWQEQLDVLEPDYPYAVKCPLDNRYGMHLYSRLPLSNSGIDYLLSEDNPSIHTLVTLPGGQQIRCHFLHPEPPSPTESDDSVERDAELLVVARSVADSDMPTIVSGDLNDVAWSRTTRVFRKVSGLLDPRVGRGMFNTFHAQHWFLRWPLDHLFHSHHFTLVSMSRQGDFSSDHFALVTELMLEGPDTDQEGLDEDEEARRWARSKHRKAGVSKQDVPEPED